uniref:Uncharacterized protein n=1 Tax=Arundo donax TaxID=35708 RepID=A0A0A9B5T4_ARUDO
MPSLMYSYCYRGLLLWLLFSMMYSYLY